MKHLFTIAALVGLLVSSGSAQGPSRRNVLIRTAKPYDGLAAVIQQAGGTVTHRFKHVSGIAAEVPESALAQLESLVGPDNIGRDDIIPLPETQDPRGGPVSGEVAAETFVSLDNAAADVLPADYNFNAEFTNVAPLHEAGFTGAGLVIAVIDSGYRPMFQHVAASRIIAPGINLVPGATEPPAVDNANGFHGTFVAGMAAAAAGFCFNVANRFVVVAEHYGAAFPSSLCGANPALRLVPMVGSAPDASVLPVKVFPAAGGGAPTSRVIAAMEAVIDLRQEFDAGTGGYNIQVANLSLGGPTNAAARTLVDQTVEAMINADIVPAIAAGNEGFPSVTIGSPGTSFAALTVGSASSAQHEHIFRSHFSPQCRLPMPLIADPVECAKAYRPDMNMQISEFSSRGPSHDGRPDPDVVAMGSFNFGQGSGATSGTVVFASGTSFATPTVAGIAAVLRQAVPGATARQVRKAIILSADDDRVPTADLNDHGQGFVDALAAKKLLARGRVPDNYHVGFFTRSLRFNMLLAGRWVYSGPTKLSFGNVRPAEVTDIPFEVHANTAKLTVRIHSITPQLPAEQQNQFFGDDVFMRVQSSAVHTEDVRFIDFLVAGDDVTLTFDRPEAGVWRITPSGDWTNAGRISYKVDISTTKESFPQHSARDRIDNGEIDVYTFDVPFGTAQLETRLRWLNMNGNYPISDIDVILTPPTGPVINTCNTVRTPELCVVANPVSGTWTARVVGFSIPDFGVPGGQELYTLRIEADEVVLKATKN
jgi:subtilisin family serine protease